MPGVVGALMDRFGEEWFGPESQAVLADLVGQVDGITGDLVEIGSWTGRSTVAMANAAPHRVTHAVDTWIGSPGEISAELATQRDVYAQWLENVSDLTAGNVTPHRMGWREYVPTAGPFALVFIDAEHTYREVFDAVNACMPKMSPGGIICGDDAHHKPIIRALFDLGLTFTVKATLWIVQCP